MLVAVQNNKGEKRPEVTASVLSLDPEKQKGQRFQGNKDYDKNIGEDIEVIEIRTVDFNSNVLSDDYKKKILENFKRRNTEYALSIKAMNKQKHDKAIREEK
jgi:predicted RND superfamily exporter protein